MNGEQKQRVVRALQDCIIYHDHRCGDVASDPGHNIGDGFHITREDAEKLIAFLKADEVKP